MQVGMCRSRLGMLIMLRNAVGFQLAARVLAREYARFSTLEIRGRAYWGLQGLQSYMEQLLVDLSNEDSQRLDISARHSNSH